MVQPLDTELEGIEGIFETWWAEEWGTTYPKAPAPPKPVRAAYLAGYDLAVQGIADRDTDLKHQGAAEIERGLDEAWEEAVSWLGSRSVLQREKAKEKMRALVLANLDAVTQQGVSWKWLREKAAGKADPQP